MNKIHGKLSSLLTEKINLTQTEISQGSTSHNNVRKILKNKQDRDTSFPRLLEGDFLSGSYDRGTKIRPLDDIDVLMVIDGGGLRLTNGGIVQNNVYVRGSNNPNPIINHHLGVNGNVSSKKILDLFSTALKESFPNTKISKDGQAINVNFNASNLGLDIVPCFHIVPTDKQQPERYYIPAGGDSHLWMATNPKIDAEISDSLHNIHDKNLKPIVKIIKYWNQNMNDNLLKSYHLEVLVWKVFQKYTGDLSNYARGVQYFFHNAGELLKFYCPDPTGIGDNIDTYLNEYARELSRLRIEEARKKTGLLPLPYLDSEKIILDNWSKVFNNLI